MNNRSFETLFIQRKRFYDDANFPHGFARSGDFNREQSELLERVGTRLVELSQGASAETEQEHRFQAVVSGERLPQTAVERAWLQYQRALQRRQDYYRAPSLANASVGNATAMEDDDT